MWIGLVMWAFMPLASARSRSSVRALAVADVGDQHEPDVDLAVDEQVFEVAALLLDDADLDAPIHAAEARQEVGEAIARHHAGDAEVQLALEVVAPGPDGAARIRHGAEDLPRVAQHAVALGGKADALLVAHQQRGAGLFLERLDGGRDGGLRDADLPGGPRHRFGLGDGDEIAELAQRQHLRAAVARPPPRVRPHGSLPRSRRAIIGGAARACQRGTSGG